LIRDDVEIVLIGDGLGSRHAGTTSGQSFEYKQAFVPCFVRPLACEAGALCCKIGSLDCEQGPKPCKIGHACCEIGSKSCEREHFSCEIGSARGEESFLPGEQDAVVCGLVNVFWEIDFVRCERSSPDVLWPV